MQGKLQSQRGASITFALLLFLVCAVISSVVIVSATTVGGRLSEMAQIDQRYYAVTSAADVLRHEIDGKKVTVEYGGNLTTTKVYNSAGKVIKTIEYKEDDAEADEIILTEASRKLIRRDTLNNKLSLSTSITPSGKNVALACDILEKLDSDLLVFDISNKQPADKTYTLRITFTPSITESTSYLYEGGKKATIIWSFDSMKKIKEKTSSESGS